MTDGTKKENYSWEEMEFQEKSEAAKKILIKLCKVNQEKLLLTVCNKY